MALTLLLLISFAWWRGTGTGPQVQVPMFYDAHYLFPRPWSQEQAAPGIPEEAPHAFYGRNRISQPFISAADNLAMIEVWLAGEENEVVTISLSDDQGLVLSRELNLEKGREGGIYLLSFPPIEDAQGHRFLLSMIAPNSTIERPVVTRTVGGDRLGGSLRLNEYNRPGNLALASYAQGLPGCWWLEAIGEQVLPSLFLLRIQQFKPAPFKGLFFPLVLFITLLLSIVFLYLARPRAQAESLRYGGWTLVLILSLFLLWQIGTGRVKLPFLSSSYPMQITDMAVTLNSPAENDIRLMRDVISDLWTLERAPEERFISTDVVEGLPAIRVPSNSTISLGFDVPAQALLKWGIIAEGEGILKAEVLINGEVANVQEIPAFIDPDAQDVSWFEVDLSPWSGQAVTIALAAGSDDNDLAGLWIMPRIESAAPWILNDPLPESLDIQPAAFRFDETAELVGTIVNPAKLHAGETAVIDLFWRPLQESDKYAAVFIHLLDASGNLVAQHDGQPVNNAYPLPVWQPGTIIRDTHQLLLPPDLPAGTYSLYTGLYDPVTLDRWPVYGPNGTVSQDGRALLELQIEVSP